MASRLWGGCIKRADVLCADNSAGIKVYRCLGRCEAEQKDAGAGWFWEEETERAKARISQNKADANDPSLPVISNSHFWGILAPIGFKNRVHGQHDPPDLTCSFPLIITSISVICFA